MGRRAATARPSKLRMYYSLTPLLVFSMLLVTLANNLGVMWAAIELTTLASVFLVTFYGNVTSLEAAWKYAMIGGVGLSMALFGTLLTYYAGHKLPGSDGLAGLELVHPGAAGGAARQDQHAAWRSFWCCSATAPKPAWRPCTPGSRMRTAKRRCPRPPSCPPPC